MARRRASERLQQEQTPPSYSLRKRKTAERSEVDSPLSKLLQHVKECKNLVIFTGSGLSAASGMSTFTSKNGLYERAQKKYKLSEGKKLFTYPFFERQKTDAQAFFAEIWKEAQSAVPGKGHEALASIEASGKLKRHYTLNVDGLAAMVGLSTWHPTDNPTGKTVEMHGSIMQMVCTNDECRNVVEMDADMASKLMLRQDIPCPKCDNDSIRCRIMLYDDKDGDFITPDDVFEVLEEDVAEADMILWVGISFEQSASTQYFRKAREFLLRAARWKNCVQAIVNLSEEAHFNLLSACNNVGQVEVLDIIGSSDVVLPQIASMFAQQQIAVTASSALKAESPSDTTAEPAIPPASLQHNDEPASTDNPAMQPVKGHSSAASPDGMELDLRPASGDLKEPLVGASLQPKAREEAESLHRSGLSSLAASLQLKHHRELKGKQPAELRAQNGGLAPAHDKVDDRDSPPVQHPPEPDTGPSGNPKSV